ncbi:FG-GAP repeat domain-containing protein [Chondrinema litorale]|uniref:FG-GAP repeat domain-containing protein n=1 Tax=Chondrinema litorale TaxID=2994555 RepID=UPI0025437643|nr:VCBS repeat-containing protein [Chondrinema litorale]UZR93842.1 VCBS repeat-containing protein [Chondrinema litorale]
MKSLKIQSATKFILITSIFSLLLFACENSERSSQKNIVKVPEKDIINNGHRLALTYCQGCHLFPEPSLLPKQIWKDKVLPAMAYRLGINTQEAFAQIDPYNKKLIQMAHIFPEKPLLKDTDWEELMEFYIEQAPDSLANSNQKTIKTNSQSSLFKASFPLKSPNKTPLVTLIHFLQDGTLVVGDLKSNTNFYNTTFDSATLKIKTVSAAVGLTESQASYKLLCIGNMQPNDLQTGLLYNLQKGMTLNRLTPKISETLKRPVYISNGDLDNDGDEDLVVSNHGHYTGNLIWFEYLAKNKYQHHLIKESPGFNKTIISDLDDNGTQDILALKAQGDEGIFAFLNQGDGEFKEKVILRFSPVYGSSYFEWVDMNNDGLKDIVYSNGDNADFSTVLKPYHGIRIFLNQGDLTFEEQQFIPLHGATKVLVADYDQDGDMDMAAIAFFPDFDNNPEQGFAYFENKGNLNFQANFFNEATNGRWLTMDKGDFDNDGDIDLVLGSFIHSQPAAPDSLTKLWTKEGNQILYLENTLNTVEAIN